MNKINRLVAKKAKLEVMLKAVNDKIDVQNIARAAKEAGQSEPKAKKAVKVKKVKTVKDKKITPTAVLENKTDVVDSGVNTINKININ